MNFNLLSLITKPIYAAAGPDPIIGNINIPTGVPQNVAQTGDILSAIIRFIVVIAGLYTLWQFLTGGLALITSNGDKAKLTEGQNKIQSAILGLVVIAASFIIIAIVSKLLFGSFDTILNPSITPV